MDDLGFNKIAGAVLATGLGMLLLMKVPGVLIAHADDSIAYDGGYVLGDTDDQPTPEDLPFPQQDWIDAMDAAKGAKVFNKCKACHNAEVGGGNGTGPALYGVVENDIAAQEGFKYSSALTNLPDNWTYEALDSYLAKPSNYAPGTNMTFFGLKKASDRAAVIEYLRVADPAPSPRPIAAALETMEKADPANAVELMEKPDVMEDSGTMEKAETMEKADTMDKSDIMEKTEMVKPEDAIEDAKDAAKDVMEEKVDSAKDDVVEKAKDLLETAKDKE